MNEKAEVDKALEPKLTNEQLKHMYTYMLMARRADERFLNLQRQGRIGTFPQTTGHEAISMGASMALKKTDWHVPAYRELAGMLHRGWTLVDQLLLWAGYEQGQSPPNGVNDLPICVPIASQLLHAAGIGMAMNIKGDKHAVLTYLGDGATSEGDCHEAFNFASVFKAPVVFVCNNNQWAISVPLSRQMGCETVAQKAIAYGMPGIRVDGNDVLAIYAACNEALERARSGGGPTLIECLTFRIVAHTTADDPKKYQKEEIRKEWAAKEPLIRFAKYLRDKGILSDEVQKQIDEEIESTIREAIAKMDEKIKTDELANPLYTFDYLYAEVPPFLQKQRNELARYLGKDEKSSSGAKPNHAHAGSH